MLRERVAGISHAGLKGDICSSPGLLVGFTQQCVVEERVGITALCSLRVCGVVAFGAGEAVSPFVVVP